MKIDIDELKRRAKNSKYFGDRTTIVSPAALLALCEVVVAAKRSVMTADGFMEDGTSANHEDFNKADEALRKALEPFPEG